MENQIVASLCFRADLIAAKTLSSSSSSQAPQMLLLLRGPMH
jgi:hypothetical protein